MLAALCALVLLGAAPAAAQFLAGGDDDEDPFNIRADNVDFETARGVYVARGDVRVEMADRVLSADWVAFSNKTRQGIATGHVVVQEANGDVLEAELLHFGFDDVQGVIYDGRLTGEESEFKLEGGQIRRLGDDQYVFRDAVFSSCRCPDKDMRDPWRMRASEAKIETEGYATTKNTKLDILHVPVFWLPWMRYPVKSERQTGVLFPTFGQSSRSGIELGLPFFWAARKNINVIIEPRWIGNRGFKPLGEVEYVFGERSAGELFGSFIQDGDVGENAAFGKNRWGIEWIHEQHLPAEFVWKVDARFASDNNYPFDFRDFSRFRSNRFLEALTYIERQFGLLGRYGATLALQYADDLSAPDNLDRDDFLLHRMPDLRLRGRPFAPIPLLDNALFSFETRYTHFWAKEDALSSLPEAGILGLASADGTYLDTGIDALPDGREPDSSNRVVTLDGDVIANGGRGQVLTAADYLGMFPMAPPLSVDGSADDFLGFMGPEGDGIFSEGEPVADRGHRFVLNPRIAAPLRIADALEILPELGWHGTFYSAKSGSAVRNLVTAQVDMRTRFRGAWDVWQLGPVSHVMEPRMTWTAVYGTDQTGNPLFIPRPRVMQQRLRQLDPWNVTRDPSDRIDDANMLTIALGNRFYRPPPTDERGDIGPAHLLADATISFQHDFENSAFTAAYIDGTLFPTYAVRSRFNLGWNFDTGELSEALFQTGWSSPKGHDLRVTYRYVSDIPRFFDSFRGDKDRFNDFEAGFAKVNQIDVLTRIAITRQVGVTYRIGWSFESSLILANEVGLEYLSRCYCWALRLEFTERRGQGFTFGFNYRVVGLGQDTVRPFKGQNRRTRASDSVFDEY